jgi:predicted DNA binding CopG/RHH family protein
MIKKQKTIPKFTSYDQEVDFWDTHDMTEYMTEITEPVSFPNLKMTTRKISLRLPEGMIKDVKMIANKMDVPYQSLLKQFIFKGLYPFSK